MRVGIEIPEHEVDDDGDDDDNDDDVGVPSSPTTGVWMLTKVLE